MAAIMFGLIVKDIKIYLIIELAFLISVSQLDIHSQAKD